MEEQSALHPSAETTNVDVRSIGPRSAKRIRLRRGVKDRREYHERRDRAPRRGCG